MQRQYQDGDVIFSEGEPGLAAFVVISGTVELFKQGPKGAVLLAVLKKGEMFGEMGALDKAPRSATAKASGPVNLHVLPRTEFLDMLTKDGDMALRIMAKLVERLRAADERLVAQHQAHAPRIEDDSGLAKSQTKSASKETGLLDRLFGRGRGAEKAPTKSKPLPPPPPPAKVRPLTVLVAPLIGDDRGAMRKALVDALNGVAGIKALSHAKPPQPTLSQNPEADLPGAAETAVQALIKAPADLMLWGDLDHGGRVLEVRLSPNSNLNAERTGAPSPFLPLHIPLNPEDGALPPAAKDFLRAVVLAALEPGNGPQTRALQAALPPLAAAAETLIEGLSGVEGEERAGLHLALANVLAAWGTLDTQQDSLDRAIDHFRRAIRFIPDRAGRGWGEAHRMMGRALQSLAEKEGDAALFERAVEAFRIATGVLTFQTSPRIWGDLQNRMGQVYYRLDLEGGSGEPLKAALAAYQNALKVFTKDNDPIRWADIMNNLGQTLQLYGEQVGSEEVIRRAAESCRAALEIRTQEALPLAWAATQNNLGSALFLLSKYSHGSEAMQEAEECFSQALSVYETYGVAKLAEISEKNLRRAESHLRARKAKGATLHDWQEAETNS